MSTAPSGTAMSAGPDTTSLNQSGTAAAHFSAHSRSSTTSRCELASFGVPRRLPLPERTVKAGNVTILEGRLFDIDGHPRPGLSDQVATALLAEINNLRHDLGWLALDLSHHHIWPSHLAS
jgi:hypothetical protein